MDLSLLASGLFLGFAIAAPVGPIGVLCVRRTLANGRASGLVTGLGAATADAFYGAIAALGLTMLSTILLDQQLTLRLLGGAFLCFLGVRAMTIPSPTSLPGHQARPTYLGDFISTFFLTLTNPMTILSFAAIFAGLGLVAATDAWAGALLVSGVFLGSALWWLTLSTTVGFLRHKVTEPMLRFINIGSGMIIAGFGVITLATLLLPR